MSRKNPLSDLELLVTSSLIRFRNELKMPRSVFAMELGVSSDKLANYEYGKASVPYALYRTLNLKYKLNPHWLAQTALGPSRHYRTWDDSAFISKISPRAKFLDVYNKYMRNQPRRDLLDVRESLSELAAFAEYLWDSTSDLTLLNGLSPDLVELIEYTAAALTEAYAVQPRKPLTEKNEFSVDSVTDSSNTSGVDSPLSKLLNRVRRSCAAHGRKAQLAKFLGVPMPRISEWLGGVQQPGGETTLRMLEWVTAEEAKQTKSPGSVEAPPEPKTRLKKISDEKPKTGPP